MDPTDPSATGRVITAVSARDGSGAPSVVMRASVSGWPARKRSRSMKWQASPTMRPPPISRSCVQCDAAIAPALTAPRRAPHSARGPPRSSYDHPRATAAAGALLHRRDEHEQSMTGREAAQQRARPDAAGEAQELALVALAGR